MPSTMETSVMATQPRWAQPSSSRVLRRPPEELPRGPKEVGLGLVPSAGYQARLQLTPPPDHQHPDQLYLHCSFQCHKPLIPVEESLFANMNSRAWDPVGSFID